MKRNLPLLLLPLLPAIVHAETVSENRALDARVQKVQIEGVLNVTLKQGATPSLVVYGEKGQLARILTSQQGDSLKIDTERADGHKKHELRAEITLPKLSSLTAAGVGRSEVQGFSGEKVQIELKGAGTLKFEGQYKEVHSILSGVGQLSMQLSNNERTEFKLSGAGSATLRGQSKDFRADLSGLGSLEAEKFEADNLYLKLKGMGSASAFAKQSANINLAGMGSANVYGNPSKRSVEKSGMGSLNWR